MTYLRTLVLATLACVVAVAAQPAHAQNSDYWKSAAIVGGSTAAGAYIGHKITHSTTGTMIGAGTGAALGYAIDARRRRNADYNNAYGYVDPNAGYGYGAGPYSGGGPYTGQGGYGPQGGYGSYDPAGGYYGGQYPGNGGAPYGYPYPGFQSRSHRGH